MKTTNYQVSFANSPQMPRWRSAPAATSDHDAICRVLASTRKGALQRYATRRTELKCFVSRPGIICHDNGMPLVVEGYTLKLGKEAA
jgi:hypothetical protein